MKLTRGEMSDILEALSSRAACARALADDCELRDQGVTAAHLRARAVRLEALRSKLEASRA